MAVWNVELGVGTPGYERAKQAARELITAMAHGDKDLQSQLANEIRDQCLNVEWFYLQLIVELADTAATLVRVIGADVIGANPEPADVNQLLYGLYQALDSGA